MYLLNKIIIRINNLKSKCLKIRFKLQYGSKHLSFKKGSYFRKPFKLILGDDATLVIGENVFFNHFCSINCLGKITIGDNTIFGENVHIYDHNHKYKDSSPINTQGFSISEVTIGNNCWIGSNVIILKGVKIGDHSVIGAGCVIYKDVEPNSVIVNKQELVSIVR